MRSRRPDDAAVATRRQVLGGLVGTGAGWLFGCSPRAGEHVGSVCADELRGGTLLGLAPFLSDGTSPLDTPIGSGLDGRLYTDLERLPEKTPTVDSARFYIRTRYPDRLDPRAPWVVRVRGLVEAPVDLELASIVSGARPLGVHLMECSGNGDFARFGMLSAAEWGGVPLTEVLESRVRPLPAATRVRVSGFDDHSQPSLRSTAGASWVFSWADLARSKAFLATTMNGEPLPPDHGAPVRLLVPGWYGCTCTKWVDSIDLVGDDEPATSQMIEFASRTMQDGTPELARDYKPAVIDQAAMPVRVERWSVDGSTVYRIVGVMWGGSTPTDALSIRIGDAPPEPVSVCPPPSTNATWTWWSHVWRPRSPGVYEITMTIDDPTIVTRRLDSRFYARRVQIESVP